MYPTRRDIIQASELSHELAVIAAVIFRKEFRDEKKATAKYLSAIDGSASMGKMSDEYLEAEKGIEATNNASERLHGASTGFLQVFGTISILHLEAGGQAAVNNDSGRAHKLLVSGKKSNPEKAEEGSAYQMGSKFQLPNELQQSLLIHSKEYAPVHKKDG